ATAAAATAATAVAAPPTRASTARLSASLFSTAPADLSLMPPSCEDAAARSLASNLCKPSPSPAMPDTNAPPPVAHPPEQTRDGAGGCGSGGGPDPTASTAAAAARGEGLEGVKFARQMWERRASSVSDLEIGVPGRSRTNLERRRLRSRSREARAAQDRRSSAEAAPGAGRGVANMKAMFEKKAAAAASSTGRRSSI
ncbi:unnamed protein product, partial [Scytosiphon promiscuus]